MDGVNEISQMTETDRIRLYRNSSRSRSAINIASAYFLLIHAQIL